VCHQSVSLVARFLEEHGVPTVVMGCARDIVERAGVPRFWWSDFPLGHSAGKPHDGVSQRDTLRGALELFAQAKGPNTTTVSPQVWSEDEGWKRDFMDVARLNAADIDKLKREHEQTRAMKQTSALRQTSAIEKGGA
jgi:hypothetical protein